jgi:methyltransferase (TIGR00027 family)
MELTHVSDTAHWVAFYRAVESERPDALFHDPHARALAGPRGEAFAKGMEGGGVHGGWPIVVRTKLMDDVIEQLAGKGGIDAVLNLAAGLDARPYRLKLPAALRWIEVDLPDMITYKKSGSPARRRCARSSASHSTSPTGPRGVRCSIAWACRARACWSSPRAS